MSEKFFRSEPATSWSQHAALEAEGRRLDEAARERKKKAAALARRTKAERTKIVQDEQRAVSKKLEDVPITVASTSIPSARQSAVNKEPASVRSAVNSISEQKNSGADSEDRSGDYDWDGSDFYDDRTLTSKQSSRRAVYEENHGKYGGMRHDTGMIGGRLRPGTNGLVRGGVDVVLKGPEMAHWKEGDQTHFEKVEQVRARKASDFKRNARRGPSIRDLKEIPYQARTKRSAEEEDRPFLEESSRKIVEARQAEERKAKNLATKHVKKNQWERTKDRVWVEERLKDPIYEGRDERRLRAYQDGLARSHGLDPDAGKVLDEDARDLAEESGQSLRTTRGWAIGRYLRDKSQKEEERETRVQEAWKKAIDQRDLQEEQDAEQRIVTRPEKIGMARHNQTSRKKLSRTEENVLNYGHSHMGKASFHRSPNVKDYVADDGITILEKRGLTQEKASYRSPDRGRVDISRQQEQPRRSFWKGMSERFRRFFF